MHEVGPLLTMPYQNITTILVTRDTSHLLISLLKKPAWWERVDEDSNVGVEIHRSQDRRDGSNSSRRDSRRRRSKLSNHLRTLANILYMLVTLEVFHREISPLKNLHPLNIPSIVVTLLVSHSEMLPLKYRCLANK